VQRHIEQRSTGRSRCLEQLTKALEEASNLLLTLEFQKEQYATAIDLHVCMQIARLETESLMRVHRRREIPWSNDIEIPLWPTLDQLASIGRQSSSMPVS
jgi:hypothetical protein